MNVHISWDGASKVRGLDNGLFCFGYHSLFNFLFRYVRYSISPTSDNVQRKSFVCCHYGNTVQRDSNSGPFCNSAFFLKVKCVFLEGNLKYFYPGLICMGILHDKTNLSQTLMWIWGGPICLNDRWGGGFRKSVRKYFLRKKSWRQNQ